MSKSDEYQKERTKLLELFADLDPKKLKLIEGLLDDAAWLKANNTALKMAMVETGMVKIHPEHPEIQRPVETARQYLRNLNSYAAVIKTINSIAQHTGEEGEDAFDEWLKQQRGE